MKPSNTQIMGVLHCPHCKSFEIRSYQWPHAFKWTDGECMECQGPITSDMIKPYNVELVRLCSNCDKANVATEQPPRTNWIKWKAWYCRACSYCHEQSLHDITYDIKGPVLPPKKLSSFVKP